jgi:23S rRNA (uracil1939-C5)-methyltransferase
MRLEAAEQVVLERFVPGGRALGRLADGRALLVERAAPADRIEVHDVEAHADYVVAKQWRLLVASPERAEPACPWLESCGGCDWMHVDIDDQRRHKLDLVADALKRIGKLQSPPPIRLLPAGPPLGYRNRIRFQIDAEGRVGFFSSQSHRMTEPDACAISDPRINAALTVLRRHARKNPNLAAEFAYVEARASEYAPNVTLWFVRRTPEKPLATMTQRFVSALGRDLAVAVDGVGDPALFQRYDLTSETFLYAPAGAFVQVNPAANRTLVETVRDGALSRGHASFADLYAGAGNFSLPLLAAGFTGVAIEQHLPSVLCARRAAREQGLDESTFETGSVRDAAKRWIAAGRRFDLVLADPPRAGIKQGLDAIARLAARHIAICSCNPSTLARDLAELERHGFEIEELLAVDMFPQTHHVEVLAWLVPSKPR